MGSKDSQSTRTELEALHAALVRKRSEDGTLEAVIPLKEWQAILARVLNVMTRQTAADKTYAMACLGLIEHKEKVGVRVLPTAAVIVALEVDQ